MANGDLARANFAGYGESWSLSDFRGQKLVWHTGGWPGMVSRLTLVPGEKLGVVVLTNQEVGAAFNAITLSVLDAYLGGEKHDWVDAYAKAVVQADAVAASLAAAQQAVAGRGRAFLRASGTEPVVRVTVEADDATLMQTTLDRLAEAVKAAAA